MSIQVTDDYLNKRVSVCPISRTSHKSTRPIAEASIPWIETDKGWEFYQRVESLSLEWHWKWKCAKMCGWTSSEISWQQCNAITYCSNPSKNQTQYASSEKRYTIVQFPCSMPLICMRMNAFLKFSQKVLITTELFQEYK